MGVLLIARRASHPPADGAHAQQRFLGSETDTRHCAMFTAYTRVVEISTRE